MKQKEFSLLRWALTFLLPAILFIIFPSALYTYLVDPLWQWPHPYHLERWHRGFNERQQKTNYLASREVNIDTLIFGTSRSTNFKTEWLESDNGFNYAVNSGRPWEFAEYIEYAKKRSGMPLKLVMVEVAERCMFDWKDDRVKEGFYIENAEDSNKKIRNLFSLSVLEYALETSKTPEYGYYHINMLGEFGKDTDKQFSSAEEKQQVVARDTEDYAKTIYSYPYVEEYPQYLSDIHKAAGNAEVIIYTPPVAWQLMKAFAEMGHLDMYEARLRELVAEFGRVYHFFYPNAIVMDNGNFNDGNHPTAAAAELIVSIIMRLRSGEIEEDREHGGILLTSENIEELLPRFRAEMEELSS